MAGPDVDPSLGWVTASELAEYAYCPRAHWYRRHPPPEGPSTESRLARTRGERFHGQTLARRDRRERWSAAAWILALVGLGFCLAALRLVGAL